MKRVTPLCLLVATPFFILIFFTQSAMASPNPTCQAPSTGSWTWVAQDWGGYHHYQGAPISFTVDSHIWFVDYFDAEATHRAYTGDTVTHAIEASAFCYEATATPMPPTQTPSPTVTITPVPTVTPSPTITPTISYLYLPAVMKGMPNPPAEALCSWPSADTRWTWTSFSDNLSGWKIGPLDQSIQFVVPDHIFVVYSSYNGANNPPAYTDQTVTAHEATAFCK